MYKKRYACMVALVCLFVTGGILFANGCGNKKKDHHEEREAAAIAIASIDWGVGSWQPTSSGPGCPSPRVGNTIVYTGSEIIVWGGSIGDSLFVNTGGIYNIQNNTWRSTSTGINCPARRIVHTAIWTGSRMIIWGGYDYRNGSAEYYSDGASYDPATDTWYEIDNSGDCPTKRSGHSAVWTGNEMIIWGGTIDPPSSSREYFNSGGIYDPISDSWAATSTGDNCSSGRFFHHAVWTGDKMLIWGGIVASASHHNAYYDPGLDSWEPAKISFSTGLREGYSGVYTGNEIIVWGGISMHVFIDGGTIYNLQDNTSNPVSTAGDAPSLRFGHTGVWTGSKMIIWGGSTQGGDTKTGGIYDPVVGSWEKTYYGPGTPSPRYAHSAIWIGDSMFVWGGWYYNKFLKKTIYLNTGGIFTP